MTRSLHDALEETLGFIQRALDRIQAGEAVEAELHNGAPICTRRSCASATVSDLGKAERAGARDRARLAVITGAQTHRRADRRHSP